MGYIRYTPLCSVGWRKNRNPQDKENTAMWRWRWEVGGGRWEVGGGRWEVGGGRWEVGGGVSIGGAIAAHRSSSATGESIPVGQGD
jgi:hypothetical protein